MSLTWKNSCYKASNAVIHFLGSKLSIFSSKSIALGSEHLMIVFSCFFGYLGGL